MNAVLPQDERDPSSRANDLRKARERFGFDHILPGLPVFGHRDLDLLPGASWFAALLPLVFKTEVNWRYVIRDQHLAFDVGMPDIAPTILAKLLKEVDTAGLWRHFVANPGVDETAYQINGFSEYMDLFAAVALPPGFQTHLIFDNDYFTASFLQGLNPLVLRRANVVLPHFALTDAQLKSQLPFAQDSLESLMAEGRLYYADYAILDGFDVGDHPAAGPRTLYAPIVALATTKDGTMHTIGIQTGQDPSLHRCWVPTDRYWDWMIAKTIARSANANHHELVSHLSWTHMIMDVFIELSNIFWFFTCFGTSILGKIISKKIKF
jgi:hypothetical protein